MSKFSYKVILVGSAAVGKTNIILRYVKDTFVEDLGATIGVNFLNKEVQVHQNGQDYSVDLVIWDIGGYTLQDMLPLKQLYCQGAHAAIYIYDITRYETFDDLGAWNKIVNKYAPKDIIRCLVANKNDLKGMRQVSREKGRKKSRELVINQENYFFFETSAKTGEKIEDMFIDITKSLIEKVKTT
ncbi:MAG: Rab family GTPase [Promethearchaeota archaeon]